MEKYYQFRISLNDVTPEVWRTFQVSELHSLFDLHQVIQVVMGWENDHLFQFKKQSLICWLQFYIIRKIECKI